MIVNLVFASNLHIFKANMEYYTIEINSIKVFPISDN